MKLLLFVLFALTKVEGFRVHSSAPLLAIAQNDTLEVDKFIRENPIECFFGYGFIPECRFSVESLLEKAKKMDVDPCMIKHLENKVRFHQSNAWEIQEPVQDKPIHLPWWARNPKPLPWWVKMPNYQQEDFIFG